MEERAWGTTPISSSRSFVRSTDHPQVGAQTAPKGGFLKPQTTSKDGFITPQTVPQVWVPEHRLYPRVMQTAPKGEFLNLQTLPQGWVPNKVQGQVSMKEN